MSLERATCCINHPFRTHEVRHVLWAEANAVKTFTAKQVKTVVVERQHCSRRYTWERLKLAFVYYLLSGS